MLGPQDLLTPLSTVEYEFRLDLGSSSVRGPPPSSPGGDEGEHPSELSEGLSLQSVPTFADALQDFMEGHLQGVQEGGSL